MYSNTSGFAGHSDHMGRAVFTHHRSRSVHDRIAARLRVQGDPATFASPPLAISRAVNPFAAVSVNPGAGKIVYYLRYIAASMGMKAGVSDDFLGTLLTQMERDKVTYSINFAAEQQDVDSITSHALATFKRADTSDRSGIADMSTVKAYKNASVLLSVARIMSADKGVAPDAQLEKITKHCKGRTVEIFLAIKEGRPPPLPTDGADLLSGLGEDALSAAASHLLRYHEQRVAPARCTIQTSTRLLAMLDCCRLHGKH